MAIDTRFKLVGGLRDKVGCFLDENLNKGLAPDAAQVTRLLEKQFPLGCVAYKDGSIHGLQEYSDMLISTALKDAECEAVRVCTQCFSETEGT